MSNKNQFNSNQMGTINIPRKNKINEKKMRLCFLLCLFACSFTSYSQMTSQVISAVPAIEFDSKYGYDIIRMNDAISINFPGKPMIPVKTLKFTLPVEAIINDIIITDTSKVEFQGSFTILPGQYPEIPDGSSPLPFTGPDTTVYNSQLPYPGKVVELSEESFLMGYKVVTVKFYPVQYLPALKQVLLYDTIGFSINYDLGPSSYVAPLSISSKRKEMILDFVEEIVQNDSWVKQVSGGINGVPTDNCPLDVSLYDQFPFNQGILPDYLIITTNSLKASFLPFAEWKSKKGVPTAIVTLEDDIIGKFPGCDSSEQIRNYLISMKNKFGPGLLVLLGGDINLIPSRIIRKTGPHV